MEIPEISIPDIYIPNVPAPYTPYYLTITKPPDIDVPGCTYQHRDIKNTGNRNLLLEDPNGVYTTCDFPFPSFFPLDYTPENLIMVEEPLTNDQTPEIPEPALPEVNNQENKEEEIVIPECPSSKDLRLGDFRNEKKLERVIGHKLSDNKRECITLYESVEWKDQYIPSAPQFVGVFSLALVGSSAPLILNAVKPLVKQIITKMTKKKDKINNGR